MKLKHVTDCSSSYSQELLHPKTCMAKRYDGVLLREQGLLAAKFLLAAILFGGLVDRPRWDTPYDISGGNTKSVTMAGPRVQVPASERAASFI